MDECKLGKAGIKRQDVDKDQKRLKAIVNILKYQIYYMLKLKIFQRQCHLEIVIGLSGKAWFDIKILSKYRAF